MFGNINNFMEHILHTCRLSNYHLLNPDSGELVLPRQLALNGRSVTCAGDPEELQKLCSHICELDLADNNLHLWTEVRIHKYRRFCLPYNIFNVHRFNCL